METPKHLTNSAKITQSAISVIDRDRDIKSENTAAADSTSNDTMSTNLSNLKVSSDKVTSNGNDSKINLVGGHINQIKIESKSVLHKKTSLMEVLQYDLIFLKAPLPFDANDR